MSLSFGPIESRADFFDALARTRAYAESEAFWDASVRRAAQRQLRAIAAWTDRGRAPLWAERASVDLGWVLARAREGTEGAEPPEYAELADLTRNVAWFFASWPEDDVLARTARFWGALAAPRAPARDEIRAAAAAIYTELVGTGRVDTTRPPDEAFHSKAPLFSDRMSTTSWVQWVLLPRLEAMVKGEAPIPPKSQLCKLCMHLAEDRALWPLLYALGALDDLFLAPMKNHEP